MTSAEKDRKAEKRRRHARFMLIVWYANVPVALALSYLAIFVRSPWDDVLLAYVTLLSVLALIVSGHAALNADLPS